MIIGVHSNEMNHYGGCSSLNIDRSHPVLYSAFLDGVLNLGRNIIQTILMMSTDLYNVLHFVNLKNLQKGENDT